eukprot:TRINITY_DN29399_c0_g1_i1.p1 TRINITY_DN29399_c0_g1~~TRINITY_DN29399_c0_g1_i1.p1  ORF type:complete len:254 (-),score=31.31 TRINITY_DN29399_c0_g1_i1:81-842(-)
MLHKAIDASFLFLVFTLFLLPTTLSLPAPLVNRRLQAGMDTASLAKGIQGMIPTDLLDSLMGDDDTSGSSAQAAMATRRRCDNPLATDCTSESSSGAATTGGRGNYKQTADADLVEERRQEFQKHIQGNSVGGGLQRPSPSIIRPTPPPFPSSIHPQQQQQQPLNPVEAMRQRVQAALGGGGPPNASPIAPLGGGLPPAPEMGGVPSFPSSSETGLAATANALGTLQNYLPPVLPAGQMDNQLISTMLGGMSL